MPWVFEAIKTQAQMLQLTILKSSFNKKLFKYILGVETLFFFFLNNLGVYLNQDF